MGLPTEREYEHCFKHITDLLQLHEEVQITYLVDNYQAVMITRDGAQIALTGRGGCVYSALNDLDAQLSRLTLQQLRDLPGEVNPAY